MLSEGHELKEEGFVRLALEHRSILEPLLLNQEVQHSCSTFSSIFIWDVDNTTWWKIENDCLILISNNGKSYVPLVPRGPGDKKSAFVSFKKLAYLFGWPIINIDFVDEKESGFIPNLNLHEPYSDYIYETQSIIDLKGSRYASKRNARNSFLKNYSDVECLPYDISRLGDCIELLDKWHPQSNFQNEIHQQKKRDADYQSTLRALNHFQELNLTGMTLNIDGKLAGFTFGEILNNDTCNIIIEKTDRNFKGSAEFIWSEFLARYWKDSTFCNAGDDWGVPSLAWTKKSYHPISMLPKWSASCAV